MDTHDTKRPVWETDDPTFFAEKTTEPVPRKVHHLGKLGDEQANGMAREKVLRG